MWACGPLPPLHDLGFSNNSIKMANIQMKVKYWC